MGGKVQKPYAESETLEQDTRVNTLLNQYSCCLHSLEKESRENANANREIAETPAATRRSQQRVRLRFQRPAK